MHTGQQCTVHTHYACLPYLSASFVMCHLCVFCHFSRVSYNFCFDVQTCHVMGGGVMPF